MEERDVVGVRELRSVVRWFDDPEAFELLRGMRDAKWAVAEKDSGRLAGMVGAVPLGDVGVLCHLAVGGEYRRMGLGTGLASWAVAYLRSRGVSAVRLYSTPAAERLYSSLGFRPTCFKSVYRCGGDAGYDAASSFDGGCRVETLTFGDLPELYGLDLWSSGMDRSHIIISTLRAHPGGGMISRDRSGRINGYLIRSSSGNVVRIGPFLAPDDDTARTLLLRVLAGSAGRPVEVGTVGAGGPDDRATELLRGFGFTGHREKVGMELGLSDGETTAASNGLHQYATTAYLST